MVEAGGGRAVARARALELVLDARDAEEAALTAALERDAEIVTRRAETGLRRRPAGVEDDASGRDTPAGDLDPGA